MPAILLRFLGVRAIESAVGLYQVLLVVLAHHLVAVGGVTLVLAYAAIFYALYLDWAKMRPLRKGQSVGATKSQKAGKADVSDSHGEPTAKTSNPSSDDTTSTAEKS